MIKWFFFVLVPPLIYFEQQMCVECTVESPAIDKSLSLCCVYIFGLLSKIQLMIVNKKKLTSMLYLAPEIDKRIQQLSQNQNDNTKCIFVLSIYY